MDLKKIPVDIQCLLSASASVNNYKRAIEELVYNSLDAESTCIAIRINIQNHWMQVVDNGTGVKKADYKLLGIRYTTSKLIDNNTLKAVPNKYGYQGQALANIISVSQTVKISSRCADTDDTWVKTFLKGKTERDCFEAPMRPSKGTTVEINGFLYNLNIQKKYVNAFKELQDIKTFLEQLSFIFNNVSISLRNDSKNEVIFKMHKNRDVYQTLKTLFNIDRNEVQELQVEKNEYKVKALIGINTKYTRNCHWIYLNNKFVNNSNVHKIIDNKFAKPKCTKIKKINTAGANGCNEENSALYEFIPFYILFIICPNYEYDIVNSGNHTIIQFKDWTQINNLIEKLVKFYNGEIHLLDNHDKAVNQISKKTEDTKDEIKKLMEKILGRPNKTAKVSQLPNGIKGRRIRRRKKKQQVNVSLRRIIPPKTNSPCKNLRNSDNINLSNNKVAVKIIPKHCNSNTLSKPIINPKFENKTNKKSYKIFKGHLKCKCNKKYVNVIDKFKSNVYTIKRRCSKLSNDIKYLLDIKNCKETKDISNQIRNKTLVRNNKQYKTIDKERDNYLSIKTPDIVESQRFRDDKKPVNEKYRSSDLLNTVLNTQQCFFNEESRKENEFKTINRSSIQRQTSINSYYFAPKLTFESHKYNNNRTLIKKRLLQKVQFISKQSKDNFNIGADKREDNILIRRGKNTKGQSIIKPKNKKKHDIDKLNILFNKHNKQNKLDTPFYIEMSGTDIIEVSKQIRNQVINDMNSLVDKNNCDKINILNKESNMEFNLNIEGTYTILMDSFCNTSQAFNIHKNEKLVLEKTVNYKNISCHNIHRSNDISKTTNEILMPDIQDTFILNVDGPLGICEAIVDSPKHIQDDSNNRMNIVSQQDPSIIVKDSKNISKHLNEHSNDKAQINSNKIDNIQRIKQNEEINTFLKPYNETLAQVKHGNDEPGQNENDTMQDNNLHNFKLKTRHRFVPKGMSQIFNNCFLKNICSYNLDTEYFETTIYNNFVEDVAVNCEILEPNVQNLKEFTTGNIHKVNERLNKHNSDLMFGADSLKTAKVVLGQVDNKFIAAIIQGATKTYKSSEFLVLFDQHAVHERIRLDKNLSCYFIVNNWKKVAIDTISLKSSKEEILYLHNHKDKFTQSGLEWTILNTSEIIVTGIPEAIRGKNPRSMDIIVKAVKDLILEQMHAIKYLKGNISLYPQSIMNLVFSEACRYAIKFGDNLSKSACVELIATLADCKTPFQCAHGRPVMAVMIELDNEKTDYKINMENILQFKTRINNLVGTV